MRTAICCVTIAALALLVVWADRRLNPVERVERGERVERVEPGIVHTILDESKTTDRLIDRWPDAPRVMPVVSEVYNLPPALLPAIARAEGMTEKMHQARNPYGLEYRGRLLEFEDYFYSTAACAQLLDRNRERWETENGVDVERLARWWCPVNWRQWAKNVKGATK